MAPARNRLRKALRSATFREPEVAVVANVDGLAHQSAEEWQALLSAQLCSPVRWRQSVLRLAELAGGDTPVFVELGAGAVLSGLIRRILPSANAIAVGTPGDLDRLVETVSGDSALHTYAASHHGEHLYVSERMVISPGAGVFTPADDTSEGAAIEVGTVVGRVGDQEVCSPFAGRLMGMLALPGERVQISQPVAWLRAG